ncbi:MAG: transporter substrate-binding domain-containing protein [Lachnospiraceae bacterium]|nr:transporter substrate-binding domain-containing protein [Lachnospiraceae bacterium]
MKKKTLVSVLLGVCAFALSACGNAASTEDNGDFLSQVKGKGTLTVAMEGDWAPWSYHDPDSDAVVGFDADVARAIGEEMGLEVTIVEAPWESLFAGLDAGRYDLVINGVEVTPEREETYTFSVPYGYIRTALIVRSDNEEIKTFEDLNGKSTVNSIASTYMDLAESYGATATGVSTLNDTLQNVLDGRADATLNADVSFYDYMNANPDAELKIAAVTEEASKVSVPMRKGEEYETFHAEVDAAIKALRESGKLKEISEKYFGSDITAE